MILGSSDTVGHVMSIPRESGDDPQKTIADRLSELYSPRERG